MNTQQKISGGFGKPFDKPSELGKLRSRPEARPEGARPPYVVRLVIFASLILGLTAGNVGSAAPASPLEAVAVIRQDCSGYPGAEPCYTSLAAWEADFGGIDFGLVPSGDLVAAGLVAVARIEGTWTQPDTAPLDLGDWVTDAAHYIRIYTAPEARHHGVSGTGYRLQVSGDGPIYSSAAHLRVEGLAGQGGVGC